MPLTRYTQINAEGGDFARVRSGPGKPNQKKSVHELFAAAFRNKSSM